MIIALSSIYWLKQQCEIVFFVVVDSLTMYLSFSVLQSKYTEIEIFQRRKLDTSENDRLEPNKLTEMY